MASSQLQVAHWLRAHHLLTSDQFEAQKAQGFQHLSQWIQSLASHGQIPEGLARQLIRQCAIEPHSANTAPGSCQKFSQGFSEDFRQRYELLGALGQGGMGTVYKAMQRGLNRPVAVKVLSSQAATEAQSLRFEREAQALAQLSHSHILAIKEYGHSQGRPYAVVDFLDGQDLSALLEQQLRLGQSLSIERICEIFQALASALAHCHERGVVHRDIKPSNIFLESETGRAVLIDFGLVRHLDSQDDRLTVTGEVVGTPYFMAPELFGQGEQQACGPEADVWSFGISLFYAVSGQFPFQTGSFNDWLGQLLSKPPKKLKSLRPDCPDWLAQLTEACLARQASERPSFDQIHQAFAEQSFATGRGALSRVLLYTLALLGLLSLMSHPLWWAQFKEHQGSVQIVWELPTQHNGPGRIRSVRCNEKSAVIKGQLCRAGFAEARAFRVQVEGLGLGEIPTLSPGPDGQLSCPLAFKEGLNEFKFRVLDATGTEFWSQTLHWDCDTTPPRLELESLPSHCYTESVRIKGQTFNDKCRLWLKEVPGSEFVSRGAFEKTWSLKEGWNFVTVMAEDSHKNRTEKVVKIDRRPQFFVGKASQWPKDLGPLSRSFTKLTIAVAHAPAHARIVLSPGVYRGPFLLSKPLDIVGLDKSQTVLISKKTKVIWWKARSGRLANLSVVFEGPKSRKRDGRRAIEYEASGTYVIENVEVNSTGVGVYINKRRSSALPATELRLRKVQIDSESTAIMGGRGASLDIDGLRVTTEREHPIHLSGAKTLSLRRGVVSCRGGRVWLRDLKSVTLVDSRFENGRSGCLWTSGGRQALTLRLTNCQFSGEGRRKSDNGLVELHSHIKAEFKDCIFRNSPASSLLLGDRVRLTVEHSRVVSSRSCGVEVVGADCRLTFLKATFRKNGHEDRAPALSLKVSAEVRFQDCRFMGNHGVAISAVGSSRLTLKSCKFRDQGLKDFSFGPKVQVRHEP